jgi:hypothetical protein
VWAMAAQCALAIGQVINRKYLHRVRPPPFGDADDSEHTPVRCSMHVQAANGCQSHRSRCPTTEARQQPACRKRRPFTKSSNSAITSKQGMSEKGHERPFAASRGVTVVPPTPDRTAANERRREVPDSDLERLTEPLKEAEANQGACEDKEGEMDVGASLVSDDKPTEPSDPG